jgi:hypothetical protein
MFNTPTTHTALGATPSPSFNVMFNGDYTSGTPGTTLTTGTTIYGGLTLNNNGTSMNQQVKVAVFRVERNKHNEIKSSQFIDEFWIENKPGVSIDFAVAKKLDNKYEADEIVIKQVYTVTL